MPRRPRRSTAPAGSDSRARLRELHAAPPAEFTAARNALARALAEEGSDGAERVKRLRRPTLPVWLANALARERQSDVEALLSAGERLRQAQIRALRGEVAELRRAGGDVGESVGALLRAARAIAAAQLGREPSAAVLAELERGLRAAATADADLRAALRDATLDRLPEPGGLELLSGLAAVAGDAREPAPAPAARASGAEQVEAERRARAEATRRERDRRRAAAEAERLARAERKAEARLRRAEHALDQARQRVAAARTEAERARAATRSARDR